MGHRRAVAVAKCSSAASRRRASAAYGYAIAEDRMFFRLGVDGIFSDNPDTAAEARRSEA